MLLVNWYINHCSHVCTNAYMCGNQSFGTTLLHKLFNAEHIIIILSIVALSPNVFGLTNSMGKQLIKIENLCLVASITLCGF